MIKPQELRIGNYVYNWDGVSIITVDDIRDDQINILWQTDTIYWDGTRIDKITPIPLTEEWLLKFPEWFKNLISGGYFNLNELPNGYVDVKYVHTAQNLYFDLTGDELTLNQSGTSPTE